MMEFRNRDIRNLRSKKKLAYLLQCQVSDLSLLESDQLYYVFTSRSGKKPRQIETPQGILRKAHEIIFGTLKTEKYPSWVFSCRGRSYVMNAREHARASVFMLKMDIEKFYPSCREKYVFKLFRDIHSYNLPGDIAGKLSRILTCDGHIPTGSPVSAALAFWAYLDCFNEIHTLAKSEGLLMSLYVDDMAFSSLKEPSSWFIRKIGDILNRYGLSAKSEKTTMYPPYNDKLITGVLISPHGEMKAPPQLRQKLKDEKGKPRVQRNTQRIQGLENAINQIEKLPQKKSE